MLIHKVGPISDAEYPWDTVPFASLQSFYLAPDVLLDNNDMFHWSVSRQMAVYSRQGTSVRFTLTDEHIQDLINKGFIARL